MLLVVAAVAGQPLLAASGALMLGLVAAAWVGVRADQRLLGELLLKIEPLQGPSRVRGAPLAARLRLRNPGLRPIRRVDYALRVTGEPGLALADGAPLPTALSIPARSEGALDLRLVFARAGNWHIHGIDFALAGPLGLARAQRYHPCELGLHVRPRRLPRRQVERLLAASGAPRERVGLHVNQNAGSGTELRELRDYVPGDALRSMAWRATARRQRPLVRAYEEESVRRLQLLLDVGPTMRAGEAGETPLDRAVDLCATIAELSVYDRVGLTTYDQRVYGHLEAAGGRPHLQRQLRHLMDLSRVVDADLTEVADSEVLARVGAFLEIQDGVALRRAGDDPQRPRVARTLADPLAELYDAGALYAAVADYLARERERGHAALHGKSRPARDTLAARVRLFCALRGITLPYRLTGPAEAGEVGLMHAVGRCLAARGADDLLIFTDLRGLAPEGPAVRALRLASARHRRATVVNLGPPPARALAQALRSARARLVQLGGAVAEDARTAPDQADEADEATDI
ncbi:MAG: DUF58 domain-containing protein [bacterium]